MTRFSVKIFLQAIHFPERFEVFVLDHAIEVFFGERQFPNLIHEAPGNQVGNVKVQLLMGQAVAVHIAASDPGRTPDKEYLEMQGNLQGISP